MFEKMEAKYSLRDENKVTDHLVKVEHANFNLMCLFFTGKTNRNSQLHIVNTFNYKLEIISSVTHSCICHVQAK